MGPSVKQRARAVLPQVRIAFDPRYLSLGLLWAWMNVAWNTEALAPARTGIRILSMPAWLPSAAVVVATLFLLAALVRRSSRLPRWLVAAATLAMAAGTALTLACQDAGAVPTLVLGSLTGVGSGVLLVASCGVLSEIDTERLELSLPACAVVSAVLSFAVPPLGYWPAAVCSCAAPLLAGIFALWAMRSPSPAATTGNIPTGAVCGNRQSSTPRAVLLASLTNLAAYTAICFLEVSLPLVWVSASDPWVYLVTSTLAIALILLVIGHSVRVDAEHVYRWAMPLLTCGLALSLADVQALSVLAYLISRVSSMMLEILLGLYFLTLAHRGRIGGCRAGGLYLGFCQLGVLVGNALVITPAGLDADLWSLRCALGCICLLAVASVALPWLSDESPRAGGAPGGPALGAPSSSEIGQTARGATDGAGAAPTVSPGHATDLAGAVPAQAAQSPDAALDIACARLAAAHGLSARESEVLGYLARGRSQPYIREELMLSKNTVSSHVQHIYTKLGVHSKQELIDLAESEL